MGNNKDKSIQQTHKPMYKLAAPKPIRARPPTFTTHFTHSKWLHDSPNKSDSNRDSIFTDKSHSTHDQTSVTTQDQTYNQSLCTSLENKTLNLDKKQGRRTPLSELESQMLAEEELQSIFNYSRKEAQSLNYGWQMWSPQSPHSRQNDHRQGYFAQTLGEFSNLGNLRSPLKRPSCNPMVKDEAFKKLNSTQEWQ